jgi:hypothetical protein
VRHYSGRWDARGFGDGHHFHLPLLLASTFEHSRWYLGRSYYSWRGGDGDGVEVTEETEEAEAVAGRRKKFVVEARER